jgi:hypothetical protein
MASGAMDEQRRAATSDVGRRTEATKRRQRPLHNVARPTIAARGSIAQPTLLLTTPVVVVAHARLPKEICIDDDHHDASRQLPLSTRPTFVSHHGLTSVFIICVLFFSLSLSFCFFDTILHNTNRKITCKTLETIQQNTMHKMPIQSNTSFSNHDVYSMEPFFLKKSIVE